MERQDNDLAFMLNFENIAWYEKGKVRILDRRIYPIETRYVTCETYKEVAQAIKDMVTQSEGPYITAAMGMALAAYQANHENVSDAEIIAYLKQAAHELSNARPTTSAQMQSIVNGGVNVAIEALDKGKTTTELIDVLFDNAVNYANNNYAKYTIIGEKMASLIPDGGSVLTQCFGGTVIGTMLRACKQKGKTIKMYCAETRPYFQGARLTASVACDMGFDVTVICDNMPAFAIKEKGIDVFFSASDVITMDGHVINKVGTFQIALACQYHGIPYYCTGTPEPRHKDLSSVEIEERDAELVLHSLDTKITMGGVKGYYPAFDITPPELCAGIVTDIGVLQTNELEKYFA